MNPLTLATITSSVTVLATDCLKGIATEAGKSTWNAIKSLFKWNSDPKLEELANKIAEELQKNPEIAEQIVKMLKDQDSIGSASELVSSINAEKVVVAQKIEVGQDFKM